MKKLNMGSGKDYRNPNEGWVNVDVEPRFKPDILSDMMDVEFPKDTFDEIVIQDTLDHVSHSDARVLCRKMLGWLKPSGVLNIRTPNLTVLGRLASEGNFEALKWLYGSDGTGATNYTSNVIKWCYSATSLKKMLNEVGFRDIYVQKETVWQGFEFNFRMTAIK